MLREVHNRHIKPRIIPFSYTTTASGASFTIGAGDLTITRAAAGSVVITAREPFSRTGFIFANPGTGHVTGSFTRFSGDPSSKSTWALSTLPEQGGGVTEGTVDGFVFGFDSTALSFSKVQRVASTLTTPRIVWGKITGATGAVAIGTRSFTCTRASAGIYNIKFTPGFGITPVVIATGISSTVAVSCTISAKTGAGVTISTAPETGVVDDADFYIGVIGQDSRVDSGKNRSILFNNQRKPQILVCDVQNTTGTYTMTVGGATGGADFTTLTDTAAGDFSVTIANPFAREPGIFAMPTGLRGAVSYTTNIIRTQVRDGSGVLADTDGPIYLFVIGSFRTDIF